MQHLFAIVSHCVALCCVVLCYAWGGVGQRRECTTCWQNYCTMNLTASLPDWGEETDSWTTTTSTTTTQKITNVTGGVNLCKHALPQWWGGP